MKIEFIGTGSVMATRLSASTLIDENLLIDVGSGIADKIKQLGYEITKIENCLITHLHGDHFADIPFFMVNRIGGKKPLCIYGPEGLENKIKQLYDILVFPFDFETAKEKAKVSFIEFDKMEHKEIEEETYVTAFEVEHGNCKPAYGYVIERKNKKIGFSGDTCLCESVSRIVQQSDMTILDACVIEANKAHMGLNNITEITAKYPNKKFATTHMHEETRKEAKQKNIKNLIIPEDGDVLEG